MSKLKIGAIDDDKPVQVIDRIAGRSSIAISLRMRII